MFQGMFVGLVLYFDGSLRPPRDAGFPTRGRLGRMASCGAAIYNDTTLIALGGSLLDIVPGITSADVEYDGLLFGLNRVVAHHRAHDESRLIIRGDCKAIIDQLKGKSVPRKLLPKYDDAAEYLERVQDVSFEHVLRDNNTVCDAIGAAVMRMVEQRQLSTFRSELASMGDSRVSPRGNDPTQSELTELIDRFLSSDMSVVPYSKRPLLYKEAAHVAQRLSDGMALEHAGERLEVESKLWPPAGGIAKELLLAQGISWQVDGLKILGNDKKATRLLSKHRFLLGRFDSQSVIMEMFERACDSLRDDPVGPEFASTCTISGDELSAMQTWYDQASQQDEATLRQGYWITL